MCVTGSNILRMCLLVNDNDADNDGDVNLSIYSNTGQIVAIISISLMDIRVSSVRYTEFWIDREYQKSYDADEQFVMRCIMEFINMNDMSMLYKMLGCVSWINNKQPYTLCKCNKNKRVAISNPWRTMNSKNDILCHLQNTKS